MEKNTRIYSRKHHDVLNSFVGIRNTGGKLCPRVRGHIPVRMHCAHMVSQWETHGPALAPKDGNNLTLAIHFKV